VPDRIKRKFNGFCGEDAAKPVFVEKWRRPGDIWVLSGQMLPVFVGFHLHTQ
jgi:hypothetical protein